ncbi:MAG: bifunctional glutamate N-acetyltransferase/amino-acid acetyltransferase ArgJ [Gammaproteobacteria bacterium]|nr:bifunctional glutamate N-acetyltransferase/amino-acid acetyltransferase ArgJ [Gammaproteobacteria bacterium]
MNIIRGCRLGTGRGGISASKSYQGRDDVLVMAFDAGASAAGVFTQNGFRAPPVDIAEARLAAGGVRALVVNSGNANAATGEEGYKRAQQCCALVGGHLGIDAEAALPFSTGVIGEQLPMRAMRAGIEAAVANLSDAGWLEAAKAIMTTDTVPKLEFRQVLRDDSTLGIAGIAKGAGMIAPDMKAKTATLLAFLVTDARVDQAVLSRRLTTYSETSFNRVTVDGDTSTNDACVLVATGASGVIIDDHAHDFWDALEEVMQTLSGALIGDAEGGTKSVRVVVEGGHTTDESLSVARSVAQSPLVKTAFFAEDPNWGRICMAIGNAGLESFDQSRVSISMGDVPVMAAGVMSEAYDEAAARRVMQSANYDLRISLARGSARAEMLTSDLSHEYVTINADYRT